VSEGGQFLLSLDMLLGLDAETLTTEAGSRGPPKRRPPPARLPRVQ
jgi:hypothetical protein